MGNIEIFANKAEKFQDAFQAADITSSEMKKAVQEWFNLYYQQKEDEEEDPCQQVPYIIVRKLTKTVFSEYKTSCTDRYAESILKSLDKKRKKAVQQALIGGECFLKPIPMKDGWKWTVIGRASILVFGRDIDGRITDMGTKEVTTAGRFLFTLLERRTVDDRGYLTIRNALYRSDTADSIGKKIPLQSLQKYEALLDEYTFEKPIGSVGLVQLSTPVENNVDGSSDGVSVYSAAVGLIHDINRNEAQLNGEFERGKSRVFVSDDLTRIRNGKREFSDTLFVGVDGDPQDIGVTVFSPQLRDEAYQRRLQAYLRAAESIIGLKRGLISEVETTERTATEITNSAGDYNLTVIDFQEMWSEAAEEAIRVCGILGELYHVAGAHTVQREAWSIDYGNGVLYDRQTTEDSMRADVSAKLLKPEIYVGTKYNRPWATEEDRKKIREEWMPDVMDISGDE